MNLFKELFDFGFSGLEKVKVYEERVSRNSQKAEENAEQVTIEQLLYDKKYECPVCDEKFKSKALRSGRNRHIKSDSDLKPYYSLIDPSIYEVIHCECGYTAIERAFAQISPMQKKFIKEEICDKFRPSPREEYRKIEDAIVLYKLALLTAIVKKAKMGERAYICLKIAWLYRDMKDEVQEKAFIEKALEGFSQSLGKERYPLFHLDEYTVIYIVAELYRRIGNKQEAMKYVGTLILSGANTRLKEKARDLRDIIKEMP
ncbi:MAG: DUF2225 domain-containing protein [Cellulosilyticaceae bacterium]